MDNTITKSKNEKPKYTPAVSCHLKKKKKKRKGWTYLQLCPRGVHAS